METWRWQKRPILVMMQQGWFCLVRPWHRVAGDSTAMLGMCVGDEKMDAVERGGGFYTMLDEGGISGRSASRGGMRWSGCGKCWKF